MNRVLSHVLSIFSLFIFYGCILSDSVDVIPDIDYLPSQNSKNTFLVSESISQRKTSTLKARNWDQVIFFEDFEDPDYYKYWKVYDGRPIGIGTVSSPAQYVFAGEKSAIMLCKKNKHETEGNGKYVLGEPIENQAFVRLYIRLSDHFSLGSSEGVKLFSIVGVKHRNFYRGAGHRPDGYDRYSAGLVMDNWNELYIYYYHPEQKSGYGDKQYRNRASNRPILKAGKWYCLEMMLKANNPGKRDGQLKSWIDGKLFIQIDNIRFRDTERLKMWRFYTPGYFGGAGIRNTSPKDQQIYIDNYVISRARIGCEEF